VEIIWELKHEDKRACLLRTGPGEEKSVKECGKMIGEVVRTGKGRCERKWTRGFKGGDRAHFTWKISRSIR
jgi:hypothetical protein